MNYWHIQLHPDDKKAFPPDKIKHYLENTFIIGLGDWKEGESQINQFRDKIQIGDIIAVRSGKTPIALVEVIGDHFYKDEDDFDEDFNWMCNRRRVKVLDFYNNDFEIEIPKSMGTLSPCRNLDTETAKRIINWHKKRINMEIINKTIDLLKYKHQIILQGPPGTGKTWLAKKIATDLTKERTIGRPEDIINTFVENFDPSNEKIKAAREDRKNLLDNFYNSFPKETLKDLSLQKYCIGRGDRDNFCWWIERGLKPLGYYSPGSANAYLIFWKKDLDDYSKHGRAKEIEDDEQAMKKVSELIYEVVQTKNTVNAVKWFGGSFLLKLLNTYYPNEYFPINSEPMIKNTLKIFNIDIHGSDIFEKNKRLNQIYLDKKKQFNSQIDSFEFSQFLFENFNLKAGENINTKTEIIGKGEYQLIQFHPAYSYEDFVRGIVAEPVNGNISYNVKDRILTDFTKKAKDNPNGQFVLIIDEINRANIPAVLGELIYALEYRGEPVTSMYELNNDREITLPKNLFIIGTMNTADRSVGHIDYAIRRRFAFVDVLPDENVITNETAKRLFSRVKDIFSEEYLSPDFKANDVMIGHSYFLVENEDELKIKLEYEIKPILREYLKDGVFLETATEKIKELNV
jgi:MoxR-like ATPase